MHRIAYYNSSAIANVHAAHLREHGIMAGVIDASVSAVTSIYGTVLGKGNYELVIATKRAQDTARQLLDDLERNPPEIDPAWEDEVQPDLTMLDKSLIPDCPGCKWPLSASRPLGPCQRCGTKYDLQQMIFERHGPEALAACYQSDEPLANYTDSEVIAIALDCPACSYPLDGLGVRGHCPECGAHFNRRELFGDILGS